MNRNEVIQSIMDMYDENIRLKNEINIIELERHFSKNLKFLLLMC